MLSFNNGDYIDYIGKGIADGYDFTLEDLIIDDQLHELDLSGIVPVAGANKLVHLNVRFRNQTVADAWASFQETENLQTLVYNNEFIRTQAAGVAICGSIWVKMDENRKIQYMIKNIGDWSIANIIVRGWFEKVGGGGLTNGS